MQIGLGDDRGPSEFHTTHRVRFHKRRWLISIKDLRDRGAVESWRGRFIFLPEQSPEDLPEGYYYEHQLVGLECFSPKGEPLGSVIGVETGGDQSRLVVRRGHREFLVPYVPEIVRLVDLDGRRITLDAPSGLLDDDAVIAR
jgi:16S rRNA processing protein RimM